MTATCPNCGKPVRPGAKFCGNCRTDLSSASPLCPHCNSPVRPGAKFCPSCGKTITATSSPAAPPPAPALGPTAPTPVAGPTVKAPPPATKPAAPPTRRASQPVTLPVEKGQASKGSARWLVIGIPVILACCAITFVVAFFFRKDLSLLVFKPVSTNTLPPPSATILPSETPFIPPASDTPLPPALTGTPTATHLPPVLTPTFTATPLPSLTPTETPTATVEALSPGLTTIISETFGTGSQWNTDWELWGAQVVVGQHAAMRLGDETLGGSGILSLVDVTLSTGLAISFKVDTITDTNTLIFDWLPNETEPKPRSGPGLIHVEIGKDVTVKMGAADLPDCLPYALAEPGFHSLQLEIVQENAIVVTVDNFEVCTFRAPSYPATSGVGKIAFSGVGLLDDIWVVLKR